MTPRKAAGRVRIARLPTAELARLRLLVKAYDTASIAVTQLGDCRREHKPEDMRAVARALRLSADFIDEAVKQ